MSPYSQQWKKGTKPAMRTRGVYLLKNKGRVVYVGSSESIAIRLGEHKHKIYSHYIIIEIPKGDMRQTEQKLINLHRPAYNKPSTIDRKIPVIINQPSRTYLGRTGFVLKTYLPADLDEYIRRRAELQFRTFNGQVVAMLQQARKGGI